jgi:hypothetical protein
MEIVLNLQRHRIAEKLSGSFGASYRRSDSWKIHKGLLSFQMSRDLLAAGVLGCGCCFFTTGAGPLRTAPPVGCIHRKLSILRQAAR